jgi:hypothetical protein
MIFLLLRTVIDTASSDIYTTLNMKELSYLETAENSFIYYFEIYQLLKGEWFSYCIIEGL